MSKRLEWAVVAAFCCACMLAVAIPCVANATQDLIVHLKDADGNVISDAQVIVITPEGHHLKTVQLPDGAYAYYGAGAKVTLEIEHETYGTTHIEVVPSRQEVPKGQIHDESEIHKTVVLGLEPGGQLPTQVPPPNDLCEDAIPVAVPSVTAGTTTDATVDSPGAPDCGTGITSPGVWYSVVGTGTSITVETCGASWDTKISVYCRSCGDLACIADNDDACGLQSSVTWCSEPGLEYLILVHGFGGASGPFDLTISEDAVACDPAIRCPLPPENDLCEDAIPVAVPSVTAGTTFFSSFDDVGFCGTANTTPGVWYSVVGTGTTITAATCGDFFGYDTRITVFCGTCGDLVCVDGNDDNCPAGASGLLSTVTWCSQVGADYLILVHGFGGATGDFELSIYEDGQPCTPDVACLPTGACCLADGSCAGGMTQGQCEGEGGVYQGDGTMCAGTFGCWGTFEDCGNLFEDISGTGTQLFLSDDDGEVVPIGFTFNFWGTDRNHIGVSSNGYLTFGDDLTDLSNDPIPNSSDPNDFIAPLWDDLNPNAGGTVHHQTLGTAPNRRFIAQWTDVPQFAHDDSNTFQAILFEGTNCIEFRYGVVTYEESSDDYTVGIENYDGTDGSSILGCTVAEGVCKSICPEYTDPVVCVPRVPFDIKPTSCPNPLNTRSNGVLPVAILGTEDFDVYDVDPASVTLEGVAPLRWAYEDVATPFEGELCDCTEEGPDGYMDLTLKFKTQEIVAALGVVTNGEYRPLTMEGEIHDGTPIFGQDCVWIRHKGDTPTGPPVISVGTFTETASTIHLSLSEATQVSMVIYDVRGKRVKTVVNGTLPSGDHTISWNGRDEAGKAVANGIYFCKVKAGAVEETVKMPLMK